MLKLVLVLGAVLLLVWLLVGRSGGRAKDRRSSKPTDGTTRSAARPEGMVACAHCGVHLPASAALQHQGRSFCNAAHRDSGPRES